MNHDKEEVGIMEQKTSHKIILALPLMLGILSLLAFLIYFYSANHAPYNYTQVILVGPIFSLAGIVISIFTRKSRTICPVLWRSGLIICSCSLALCLLIIALLVCLAASMLSGDWP